MEPPSDDKETAPERRAAGAQRARRVSAAEVFAAADALLVEGHRPTIDRVRVCLGRGSPNTINEHLDTGWRQLVARIPDLPGQEFPQLPEAVAVRAASHLCHRGQKGESWMSPRSSRVTLMSSLAPG